MGVFTGMFPVLAGKEEAVRAWISALAGSRGEGWDALQRRSEITRETLALQTTPVGSFLLVWFDGNVEKAFAEVATGQDDFTVWHRAQLKATTGIDLAAPPQGAPAELLLDWHA